MSFLSSIFGGSKQSQTSGNNAYPWIKSTFGPGAGSAFNSGTSGIQGLLGLPGGDPQALQKYWNGSGGQFMLNQGTDAINSNMYARGLGKSGADIKGLEDYRSGLASTKMNEVMQNYLGLAKLGLGAGSLVSDAGQFSKGGGGSSSGGFGAFLGSVLSTAAASGAFPSDPRVKTNVVWVGTDPDGLDWFDFDYRQDMGLELPTERQRGVMAPQVETLRPWAFIPNFRGEYAGVNYTDLESVYATLEGIS